MAYEYNDLRRDLVFDEDQARAAAENWVRTLPDSDRRYMYNTTFKNEDPSRLLFLNREEAERAANQWAESLPDR